MKSVGILKFKLTIIIHQEWIEDACKLKPRWTVTEHSNSAMHISLHSCIGMPFRIWWFRWGETKKKKKPKLLVDRRTKWACPYNNNAK